MARGGRLADVASLRRATPVARERLTRTVASVGSARLLVGDVLEAHGVTDRSVLDTAVLLASELATDGVRHGSGPELIVEIALASGLVQLTVTVGAPAKTARQAPGVAEHSQQVLDILASAWEVRTHSGTRTGWCRVDRPTTGAMPVVPGPGAPGPADRPGKAEKSGASVTRLGGPTRTGRTLVSIPGDAATPDQPRGSASDDDDPDTDPPEDTDPGGSPPPAGGARLHPAGGRGRGVSSKSGLRRVK